MGIESSHWYGKALAALLLFADVELLGMLVMICGVTGGLLLFTAKNISRDRMDSRRQGLLEKRLKGIMNHKRHAVCALVNLVLLALVTSFIGCSGNIPTEPNGNTNEELKEKFQTLLNSAVSSDTAIHNAVMMVEAPLRNLKWKGAAGMANPYENLQMNADDQFRIASIGKMALATLTMRLVERGEFKLGDSIYHYLSNGMMNGLHVFQGQDYGRQITIRQLLSHTSGLPDYVEDGDVNANGMPDFLELLIAQPAKFWTPEETIEYAKQHLSPLFAPGQGYHYSDTNYQLLGLILQNVSGKALNVLYRELIFDPLGMNHTYMEYYDDPRMSIPGRALSHVYFGGVDYTGWISNSADWAGGGLISTTEDLNRFLQAFVTGEILQDPKIKAEMLGWASTGNTGTYYGLGISRISFDEFGMSGFGEIYGHDGFPQSFMFYWPKQSVAIVGTLNQAVSEFHYQQLVLGVISLLGK